LPCASRRHIGRCNSSSRPYAPSSPHLPRHNRPQNYPPQRACWAAACNFRLTGIIIAGHPSDSIAIIAADGKPARPFRVNAEIKTGVRVQEIQPGYVLLQQNEKVQRLELPAAKRK
jgi:hypothetical protein